MNLNPLATAGLVMLVLAQVSQAWIVLQKDCVLHSHNFRIDEHAFAEPPDGTELNTGFILEQARMRAESRLHEHLTRAYEESGNAEFISRLPIWHNSNQNRLVHLWMSELCREAIKSVAQKTECKKLQDFLAWLTGRP